jgi:hypothetical protein
MVTGSKEQEQTISVTSGTIRGQNIHDRADIGNSSA